MEEKLYAITETVIYRVPATSKAEAERKFLSSTKPDEEFEGFVDERTIRREDGEDEEEE